MTVGRAGHPVEVLADVPHGEELTVEVATESGAVVPAVQIDHHAEPRLILDTMIGEARFVLPDDLPPGYHTLHARSGRAAAAVAATGALVLAPDRLDLPPELASQVWGLMTQLYSVRSRDSWGIGDFGDLAGLAGWGGDLGADFVLVNPLHAAEPVPPIEDSPYLPTSRRYLNPLYLRVTDVPELAALDATGRARVEALGAGRFDDADGLLDRQASYAAKLAALDLLHAARHGRSRASASWRSSVAARGQSCASSVSGAPSPSTSPARCGRPSCSIRRHRRWPRSRNSSPTGSTSSCGCSGWPTSSSAPRRPTPSTPA